jgi:hypothetical protein
MVESRMAAIGTPLMLSQPYPFGARGTRST